MSTLTAEGGSLYIKTATGVTLLNGGDPTALGTVRTGLARSTSEPVRLVFIGSSTTAGTGASLTAYRWVNVATHELQRRYLPGTAAPAALGDPPSSSPGVQSYAAGVGGTTSLNYLSDTMRAQIVALAPVAVFHMVGSNDYNNGYAPESYRTNLLAQINSLKAALPDTVHILLHSFPRMDTPSPAYSWASYAQIMQQIAQADPEHVGFLDLSKPFTDTGLPATDPNDLVGSDNVHATDGGHRLLADTFIAALNVRAVTLPASPTPLVTDTFTRADTTAGLGTATTGQAWTTVGGGWGITSGKASATTAPATATLDAGQAAVSVRAKVKRPTSGVAGIGARAISSTHRVTWYFDTTTGNLLLATLVAGTAVTRATVAHSVAVGEVADLRLDVDGPLVTAWLNDTKVADYSMTANESAALTSTAIALRQGSGGQTGMFDDLEVYHVDHVVA